jgi:predicted anti-sigma-YlaC factor YlaD
LILLCHVNVSILSVSSKGVALAATHLTRKILRIRIRLIQAVAVAPDWVFYSSLSGPEAAVDHGFAANIAIRATLMDAIEKKISTFSLNLKWFDS